MTVSRRNVLLQGCAIGAGVIATQIPGVVALAQRQPPQRRSLGDLQLNDPEPPKSRTSPAQRPQQSG
jgi:hypothetical protein